MYYSTKFFVLISICASTVAQQNGGSLHCPMEWIDGSKVSLVFLIDQTLFQNTCNSPGSSNNQPYFQRKTSASGTDVTNCTVPDITTSCGSFTSGTLGCGCVATNGSYVVEYNFNAHPDYDGWWSADLQCQDNFANPLLTFTATNCDDKKVKISTTTATPTTTTTGPPEPPKDCKVYICIIICPILWGVGVVFCVVVVCTVNIPTVIAIGVGCPQQKARFRQLWEEIREFIIANFKRCDCFCVSCLCCCSRWLDVRVNYDERHLIEIRVTTKLIRFFCIGNINNISQKIKDFVKTRLDKCEIFLRFKLGKQPQNDDEILDAYRRLLKIAEEVLKKIVGNVVISIITTVCGDKKEILVRIRSEDPIKACQAVAQMILAFSNFVLVRTPENERGVRKPEKGTIQFKQGKQPTDRKEKEKKILQLAERAEEVPEKINGEGIVIKAVWNDDGDISVEVESPDLIKFYEAVAEMITPFSELELYPPGDNCCYDTSGYPKPDYPGATVCVNAPGQGKKKKSVKEIQYSNMRGSSPPSENSGDKKSQMILPTQRRALPVPRTQHEPTSTGIASPSSRRLEPVQNDSSKMPSVERNSGAFPRKLPTPRQEPLGPIPPGKTS